MQIHRALARLRRLLPAGMASGTIAALCSPRARAAHAAREQVLRFGRAAASATTASSPLVGLLLAHKSLAISAALLIAVAAGWWWLQAWQGPRRETEPAPTELALAAEPQTPATHAPDAARDPALPTPDPLARPQALLRGRVVTHRGAPVPDTGVALLAIDLGWLQPWSLPQPDPFLDLAETRTDPDGRFALHGSTHRALMAVVVDPRGPRQTLEILGHALERSPEIDLGDIVLPPFATVTGTVVDDAGMPLAGVLVRPLPLPPYLTVDQWRPLATFRRDSAIALRGTAGFAAVEVPSWLAEAARCAIGVGARSSADGRFELQAPCDGELALHVADGFHQDALLGPLAVDDRTDVGSVTLPRGIQGRFRVVDAGGSGVQGVQVWAGIDAEDQLVDVLFAGSPTDEHGRTTVAGLPASALLLVALRRPDQDAIQVLALDSWNGSASEQVLALTAPVDVTLTLVGADGGPVDLRDCEPALWSTYVEGSPDRKVADPVRPSPRRVPVTVQEDGRIHARGLLAGRHRLRLALGAGVQEFEAVLAEQGPNDLTVLAGAVRTCTVVVRDASSGAPVPGATVTLVEPGRSVLARGVSSASGELQLVTCSEDRERLGLVTSHPDYPDVRQEVDARTEAQLVELARGGTIEGQVLVLGKPPQERLLVGVRSSQPGFAPLVIEPLTTTDAQGRFRFDDLAPGRYRVEVSEAFVREAIPLALARQLGDLYDFDKGILEDRIGEQRVEVMSDVTTRVTLPAAPHATRPGASVRGLVLVDGVPGPHVLLELEPDEGRSRFARTDATGAFTFEQVPPGEARVSAPWLTRGSTPRQATGIEVHRVDLAAEAEEYLELAFTLIPYTVQVTDPQGLPVAGCSVRLRNGAQGTTDGEGRFQFVLQAPASEVSLSLRRDGFVTSTPTLPTAAATPQSPGYFRIQLAPAVPCSGTVHAPGVDRQRLAGARMVVSTTAGASVDSVTLGADASFEIGRIGPGEYRVRVRGEDDLGLSGALMVPPQGSRQIDLQLEIVKDDAD